jgi:alkanesulfonate monooxygenase SsuD/methylene tetrahydromethanopterin reductase-like flavin-dependent oxidoreductase (luciferase family)
VHGLLNLALTAEQAGFDAVWASKHICAPVEDALTDSLPWAMFSALGSRTRSVAIGVGLTDAADGDTPPLTAATLSALETLYPARVFVTLSQDVPHAHSNWLDEMLEALRGAARPSSGLPLLVAGTDEAAAQLAGELGDGWVTDARALGSTAIRSAFCRGAASVGKDWDALRVVAFQSVVVGGTAELDQAAAVSTLRGGCLEQLLHSVPRPRRWGKNLAVYEPFATWLVSDDPAVHVTGTCSLLARGATDVFIHTEQYDVRRVIDFYARRVLPALSGTAI